MELAKTLGWSAERQSGALLCHPTLERSYLAAMGSTVLLCSADDEHDQTVLTSAHSFITALDANAAMLVVASGEVAGQDASVALLELGDGKRIRDLQSVRDCGHVTKLRLSPDGAFVAAATLSGSVLLWEVDSGSLVWSRKSGALGVVAPSIGFVTWGPLVAARRGASHPSYALYLSCGERVEVVYLAFDLAKMTFVGRVEFSALPASGFKRNYSCAVVEPSGAHLIGGTFAGELVVFMLPSRAAASGGAPVFHTYFTAATRGVLALTFVDVLPSRESVLAVGGGDGTVATFRGAGDAWRPLQSVSIGTSAGVACISVARRPDNRSATALLVGGAGGKTHWVEGALLPDSQHQRQQRQLELIQPTQRLLGDGPQGSVLSVCASPTLPADAVAVASSDGILRLYDLNTYTSTAAVIDPSSAARRSGNETGESTATAAATKHVIPTCLWMSSSTGARNEAPQASAALTTPSSACLIFAGYADGVLRGWTAASGSSSQQPAAGGDVSRLLMLAQQKSSGSSAMQHQQQQPGIGGGLTCYWQAQAHRGRVTALSGNAAVLVTGGSEGHVRVWSRDTHLPLFTFAEHNCPVVAVHCNTSQPHLVHSMGDTQLVTFDAQSGRRLRHHTLRLHPTSSSAAAITAAGAAAASGRGSGGSAAGLHRGGRGATPSSSFSPSVGTASQSMTSLSQWGDPGSECELLVGTSEGLVYIIDPDIPDFATGVIDVAPAWLQQNQKSLSGGGNQVDALEAVRNSTTTTTTRHDQGGPRRSEGTSSSSSADRRTGISSGKQVTALKASPCGSYLVASLSDERLYMLAATDGGSHHQRQQQLGPAHAGRESALVQLRPIAVAATCGRVNSLTVTPDARQAIAGLADARVEVFNVYNSGNTG